MSAPTQPQPTRLMVDSPIHDDISVELELEGSEHTGEPMFSFRVVLRSTCESLVYCFGNPVRQVGVYITEARKATLCLDFGPHVRLRIEDAARVAAFLRCRLVNENPTEAEAA